MTRRASRPQLESIEERVLTTVAGSPHGLSPLVARGAERIAPQRYVWAVTGLSNTTDHLIQWVIDYYGQNGWFRAQYGVVHPHGRNFSSIKFTVPGHIPVLELSYYDESWGVLGTSRLYPYLFEHEPMTEEKWGSPFFFRLKKDFHHRVIVIHPKAELVVAPSDSELSGLFLGF